MNTIKFYGKQLLILLITLLISSLLLSILTYFNLCNTTISGVLNKLIIIMTTLILGFQNGRLSKSKGYLEGLKLGGLFILILAFLNTIFFELNFKGNTFLYYGIILLSSTIGAMIGINKKKK